MPRRQATEVPELICRARSIYYFAMVFGISYTRGTFAARPQKRARRMGNIVRIERDAVWHHLHIILLY